MLALGTGTGGGKLHRRDAPDRGQERGQERRPRGGTGEGTRETPRRGDWRGDRRRNRRGEQERRPTETSASLSPAALGAPLRQYSRWTAPRTAGLPRARPRCGCWAPGPGWTLGTGREQQEVLKLPVRNAASRHVGHARSKEWPGHCPALTWLRRPGAEPSSQPLSPPGGRPLPGSGWRACLPDLFPLRLEAAGHVSPP